MDGKGCLVPKTVDHEIQRRRITDAVCRVTLREGLGGATFRAVATEAGVSVRLIQYYFGTKQELRLATLNHVAERSVARITERIEATDGSPKALVRAFIFSFMPTDEEARVSLLMYVALHTEALFDPTLATEQALAIHRAMHDTFVEQFEAAGPEGLAPGIDIAMEAAMLTSLLPGLGQSILDGMATIELAGEVLDYTLDRIFR